MMGKKVGQLPREVKRLPQQGLQVAVSRLYLRFDSQSPLAYDAQGKFGFVVGSSLHQLLSVERCVHSSDSLAVTTFKKIHL